MKLFRKREEKENEVVGKGSELQERQVVNEVKIEKREPELRMESQRRMIIEPEVLGKGVLIEWFKRKLGEAEFREIEKHLDNLTLQFQIGGIPFYLSKIGVNPFKLEEGRAVSHDALIIIPAELEESLASSNTLNDFLELYKEHLRKPPRIRVQLIRGLEELEKKGVLRSKFVRGLLNI